MARKKFTTNLDEEVIIQLKIQAARESTDASKIIEKLVKDYLETKVPRMKVTQQKAP